MIKRPRILIVGSLSMDYTFATAILPNEGETVLGESYAMALGGKGLNQAMQAARFGADVTLLGKLGCDANGDAILKACRAEGIDVSHVVREGGYATGCALILLERKTDGSTQNRILVIPGTNMRLTPDDAGFLRDEIGQYDLVMLQLEIPMATNEAIAKLAHEKGVAVMLNPAPSAPLTDELLSCLDYITPNEHEACDLAGIRLRYDREADFEADVSSAAEALRNRGVRNALITLGNRGAILFDGETMLRRPAIKGIAAIDPTAAGDSFVAAFGVGVCCGWSVGDALAVANQTAAITVQSAGAVPSLPTLAQIKAALATETRSRLDFSMLRETAQQDKTV